MKILLLFTITLISQSLFAGVGGSTGGDERANNPDNLEYYLGYSFFNYSVPSIEFKVEDAENIYLPIHETCIRNNDQIESISEVEITKLNADKTPAVKINEIIRRERKYLKNVSIFNREKKEVEIPRDYKINILESRSHGYRLLRTINYSISDCK